MADQPYRLQAQHRKEYRSARRTVSQYLRHLGLHRRRFLNPTGVSDRAHGHDSPATRAVAHSTQRGNRTGYVHLHSAVDGFSHLTHTAAGNRPSASCLHTGVANVQASYSGSCRSLSPRLTLRLCLRLVGCAAGRRLRLQELGNNATGASRPHRRCSQGVLHIPSSQHDPQSQCGDESK